MTKRNTSIPRHALFDFFGVETWREFARWLPYGWDVFASEYDMQRIVDAVGYHDDVLELLMDHIDDATDARLTAQWRGAKLTTEDRICDVLQEVYGYGE